MTFRRPWLDIARRRRRLRRSRPRDRRRARPDDRRQRGTTLWRPWHGRRTSGRRWFRRSVGGRGIGVRGGRWGNRVPGGRLAPGGRRGAGSGSGRPRWRGRQVGQRSRSVTTGLRPRRRDHRRRGHRHRRHCPAGYRHRGRQVGVGRLGRPGNRREGRRGQAGQRGRRGQRAGLQVGRGQGRARLDVGARPALDPARRPGLDHLGERLDRPRLGVRRRQRVRRLGWQRDGALAGQPLGCGPLLAPAAASLGWLLRVLGRRRILHPARSRRLPPIPLTPLVPGPHRPISAQQTRRRRSRWAEKTRRLRRRVGR